MGSAAPSKPNPHPANNWRWLLRTGWLVIIAACIAGSRHRADQINAYRKASDEYQRQLAEQHIALAQANQFCEQHRYRKLEEIDRDLSRAFPDLQLLSSETLSDSSYLASKNELLFPPSVLKMLDLQAASPALVSSRVIRKFVHPRTALQLALIFHCPDSDFSNGWLLSWQAPRLGQIPPLASSATLELAEHRAAALMVTAGALWLATLIAICRRPRHRRTLANVALMFCAIVAAAFFLRWRSIAEGLQEHMGLLSLITFASLFTAPLLVFESLPNIRWPRRPLVRNYPPPSCRHCGYQLSGNFSGVCPECGKATGWATPEQVAAIAEATAIVSRRDPREHVVNPFAPR